MASILITYLFTTNTLGEYHKSPMSFHVSSTNTPLKLDDYRS